jgi:peptide/nickel transport system ATP-binding protein
MNVQPSERPLLSIRDLVVEYTASGEIIHAVNGVSLDLNRRETLGLVGETGAGKTTIAKSIMRVLPDPPAKIRSGQILLDGEDLLLMDENSIRKIRGNKVSMVFQDPMTELNPVFTVGDQVSEAIKLHEKVNGKEAYDKTLEIMKKVGIPGERYSDYPHQFSGGMRQRIVIAIALSCNPDLLLADEPTTALDVTIQAQVLDMIKRLKSERGTSMIMITHDLGVVAEVCDKVAVIYAGEVIESGTREEIFDYPSHPYTIGLFGALPSLDEDKRRLMAIPGMPPNPAELLKGCRFQPRCSIADADCEEKAITMREVRPGHFCRCCRQEGSDV